MSKRRKISLHINAIIILICCFLLLLINRFATSIRLFYSIKYLGIDFYHYFISIFVKVEFDYDRLSDFIIRESAHLDKWLIIPIPKDFGMLLDRIGIFFQLLFSKWNFKLRFYYWINSLVRFAQLLYFLILLYFPARMIFNNQFAINDLSFVNKSCNLVRAEKFKEKVLIPIKKYGQDLLNLFLEKKYYLALLIIFLGVATNIFSILLDALGFLFYFSSSFKLVSIFEFVYTTLFTMYPILIRVPLIIYLLVAFLIFKHWQKKKALDRLYHFDSMNKGFAKSLGVVTNVVAPPRAGKTTTLVSLGMDFEEIFRNEFLNIIEIQSALFPEFPWCELESLIVAERDNGHIPNRYAIRGVVAKLFYVYENGGEFYFNYDLQKQDVVVDVGNKLIWLEDSLITYGEAFYYYSYPGSLIVSNFSNRADFYMVQYNNKFPLFLFSSLEINAFDSFEKSHYSRNIDFDSFRVFKRVENKEPPLTDVGIYLEAEASKQWGNQYDNREFKKQDEAANPLNDGFAFFLSSFAHASLIDYQPFIRYIMDYQRVGDLAVKFAGMAETRVTIIPAEDDMHIALPFYHITPMFYELLITIRKKVYTRGYRVYRDDQTLLFTIINKLGAWATRKLLTASNNYGFKVNHVTLTSGNEDSGVKSLEKKKYFIMHKKHYSDRFRSDALKAMYEDTERIGFLGFRSFTSLDVTEEDLNKQNSYAVLNKFNAARYLIQEDSNTSLDLFAPGANEKQK